MKWDTVCVHVCTRVFLVPPSMYQCDKVLDAVFSLHVQSIKFQLSFGKNNLKIQGKVESSSVHPGISAGIRCVAVLFLHFNLWSWWGFLLWKKAACVCVFWPFSETPLVWFLLDLVTWSSTCSPSCSLSDHLINSDRNVKAHCSSGLVISSIYILLNKQQTRHSGSVITLFASQ